MLITTDQAIKVARLQMAMWVRKSRRYPHFLRNELPLTVSGYLWHVNHVAMPINKSAHFRFEILDECLRNTKRKWTKNDLLQFVNRRLELHLDAGASISPSQLRYDLDNMQTECGAPIQMYREGKNCYYRYEDPTFSIKNVPIEQEDVAKLVDGIQLLQQIKGFTIADEMAEIVRRLERKYNIETKNSQSIISFEHAPEMAGIEHLEDIYHAIMRKNVLKITYQTFSANASRIWQIHPYLLKEYGHRWYLLGLCDEKQAVSIYALDRMKEIKVSKIPFIENSLNNGDEYFKDVIGITILPDSKVESIELLFSSFLAPYIQSKPLHRSQTSMATLEDGSLKVSLKVCINPELVSMLLGYGKDVKVLQPLHLAEKIRHIISELIMSYK